jgi:arsenite methyltransferase
MTTVLMRALDAAFGHPRGLAGRLGGAIMARGNVEQERWAVQHAELRPGQRVLVVGHGPGVGIALAAVAVAPGGYVVGVDPSATMRQMAAERCATQITAGTVELREGTAEKTGCDEDSMDVAISVNNVMLWDRTAGFAELHRVLRPGGRLVVTVHRHVLGSPPEQLQTEAEAAGFTNLSLSIRRRRLNSPAVELLAQRP